MADLNIIYIRTSTLDQHPENQIEDCKKINKYGEYTVIKEYQSAWNDNKNRPEWEWVYNQVYLGNVRHLIVWDLDRLYRNRKKVVAFFELANLKQCKVHSYRQTWLEEIYSMPQPWGDIMHKMMLNIMGWLAEEESIKKSERVKASIRIDKNGEKISYKGNKWGREKISDKVIIEVLKLHNEGLKIRDIADKVTYFDKNNNEKKVSRSFVHKIITDFKLENS